MLALERTRDLGLPRPLTFRHGRGRRGEASQGEREDGLLSCCGGVLLGLGFLAWSVGTLPRLTLWAAGSAGEKGISIVNVC